MPAPLTIAGGGLAGLTLGIALRQRGLPVTVFESGHYPRHRVCGEFISGHGRAVLARLGLEEKLLALGARPAVNAAFYSVRGANARFALPEPALCLSRFQMDAALAAEFQRLGGELVCGQRLTETSGEGIVRATGRRSQPTVQGWRWLGLKVHARQVTLGADLEMHFLRDGYVGLCQLPGGTVDVCGLFRSRSTVSDLAQTWREWLAGPPGSVLHERLGGAVLDPESFCSVAGLRLGPAWGQGTDECRIGDAIAMIPPVTGNGMSMAFESAELALEPLTAYSRGDLGWSATCRQIDTALRRRFAGRLLRAACLQWVIFKPTANGPLVRLASRFSGLLRMLFALTR